jgi:hypothetical protein
MPKTLTFALAAAVLVLCGTAPAMAWDFFGLIDNSYTVIFEDVPNIIDQQVYDGEEVLGEMEEITVRGGSVVATISVPTEKAGRITEDTVFYVETGRLRTYRLGDSTQVMPDGSYLLGFSDKLALDLFRAKRAVGDLGRAIREKAEELRGKLQ